MYFFCIWVANYSTCESFIPLSRNVEEGAVTLSWMLSLAHYLLTLAYTVNTQLTQSIVLGKFMRQLTPGPSIFTKMLSVNYTVGHRSHTY